MKKLTRIFIGLTLSLMSIVIALYVCQELVIVTLLTPRIEEFRKELANGVVALASDQALLATEEFFHPRSAQKNVGPLLNAIVRWKSASYPAARVPAGAVVGEELIRKLEAWDNWPQSHERWDSTAFDSSWMSSLLNYDHWDLEEGNLLADPQTALLNAGLTEIWEYLQRRPEPIFSELPVMAKLRLVKGLQEANPLSALREVRQLALLAYSTERLSGARAAWGILEVERLAVEWMKSVSVLKPSDWRSLEKKQLDAMSRILGRMENYFGLFTPERTFQLMFGREGLIVAKCHVIDSVSLPISFYASHLRNPYPLERNFSDRLLVLRKLAMRPDDGCRLKRVKEFWKLGFPSVKTLKSFTFDWKGLHLLSREIPYVRSAAGVSLSLVGAKNLLNEAL